MDINAILERVKNIILRPVPTWEGIKTESRSSMEIVMTYLLPLLVLAVITSLLGNFVFASRYSFGGALGMAVFAFLIPLVSIFLAAFVINELATGFGSRKSFDSAFRLVAYSFTASILAGIVANLHLSLSWISIFGLYSIYLLWTGIGPMMETPEDKKLGYVVVSGLVIVAIWIVLSILIMPLLVVSRASMVL